MKFLFLITFLPLYLFCQKKDTIDHDKLSLYFNDNGKLYKVMKRSDGSIFNGWGKFESYDGYEYRYYKNNKLLYVDFRDFQNQIIKREIACKNSDNCLEEFEYYDNNTALIKKKYFICVEIDDDGEIVEKKCKNYFEYYKNGQLKIMGQYENNQEKGLWIYLNENGKIINKINK